jgi:hypothetical protein
MNSIVQSIIQRINKGQAFDSHFIIDTIIKEHSDDYLTFVSHNLASSMVTEYAHSEISKIISSFTGTLVERLPHQSTSYNIRGNYSSCALWLRI